MTTSTLDRSLVNDLRAAASHLGHPEATVFVFNEDGDQNGPLQKVDLYAPSGEWVSGVYADGQVDTSKRSESAAWRIFEGMWDSLPADSNRFEVAPVDAPDTENWKTGDPLSYTIYTVPTDAPGYEDTVGVVVAGESDESGDLWFAHCGPCQWTDSNTRFVLARKSARIHAVTCHDAPVAGEQCP